jgi:protease I
MSTSPQATAFNRMQQLMSSSPVPSISTELLVTADGDLNRELKSFLLDPPTNPGLLKDKRIAICCTNGVEEVEILGAHRWLTEHGATVHVVSPRIGEFHPTLGLRFPPQRTKPGRRITMPRSCRADAGTLTRCAWTSMRARL